MKYNRNPKKVKNHWSLVSIAPPLLLAGVRELFELMAWAEHYYQGQDCFMKETLIEVKTQLRLGGEGYQTNLEPRRYRLPSKDNEDKLWHSGGKWQGPVDRNTAIPERINPSGQHAEVKVVSTLLKELRSKLALDMDPSPTFERGLGL
jgi:hypothetical protein